MESPSPVPLSPDDAYVDRNLLAQLVGRMAQLQNWPVTWLYDENEPDWPVLCIETPAGQITYHIPQSEALLIADYGPEVEWDGHTTEEKRQRIKEYIAPDSEMEGEWI